VTTDIHIHAAVKNVRYAPIDEVVGVDRVKAFLPADDGGGQLVEIPMSGLEFTDADGETHVFVMNDQLRQVVLQQLTGGIVLP
jgi:hypothetical protein